MNNWIVYYRHNFRTDGSPSCVASWSHWLGSKTRPSRMRTVVHILARGVLSENTQQLFFDSLLVPSIVWYDNCWLFRSRFQCRRSAVKHGRARLPCNFGAKNKTLDDGCVLLRADCYVTQQRVGKFCSVLFRGIKSLRNNVVRALQDLRYPHFDFRTVPRALRGRRTQIANKSTTGHLCGRRATRCSDAACKKTSRAPRLQYPRPQTLGR